MMFHWYVSLLQGIIHSFGPCKYILKRMKSYAAIYYKRSICSDQLYCRAGIWETLRIILHSVHSIAQLQVLSPEKRKGLKKPSW